MQPAPQEAFVSNTTLEQLDWPWLVGRIVGNLRTQPARDRCADLLWVADRDAAARAMREVKEAEELAARGAPFPLGDPPDIRVHEPRIRKGAVLEPPELLDIAAWLDAVEAVRRHLVIHRETAPLLHRYASEAPSVSHLVYDIRSVVDENGEVRDEASPTLATLRKRARKIHTEIHRRLESYLTDPDMQASLQDRFYTLKEDRYVLPVKSGQRSFVDGIVLGSSNTGATLFIEPSEIVSLNNTHKLALLEIQKEIHRILAEICDHLRQDLGEIEKGHHFLTRLDLLAAKAALAASLGASIPTLDPDEGIRLLQARHPVLFLSRPRVVPNDIPVTPPTRTLVVSGPNAGGKTAVLKTVGTLALMVRAGLPIPAADGSNLPFFDAIFADIGDSQSLQEDRSTFSGHVQRIVAFLRDRPAFSLALLDEILIGTNPDEGSVLAQAILEHLSEQGGFTLATTHFLSLKAMAADHPRIRNGAMGFDPETLEPTYALSLGLPGASNALVIARRFGLEGPILDRARALLGETGVDLQALLRGIHEAKQAAEAERSHRTALREACDVERERLRERSAALDAREVELKRGYRDRLERAFNEALGDIRRVRKRWKARVDAAPPPATQAPSESRELLDRKHELLDEHGPFHVPPGPTEELPSLDPERLRPGDAVYLPRLRKAARVVHPPDKKGSLTVEASGFRMQVRGEELTVPPVEQRTVGKRRPPPPSVSRGPGGRRDDTAVEATGERPSSRCDLRGLTVEEALDRVARSLDNGFRHRLPTMTLIHGLGKGALRRAVRDYLSSPPYPLTFRPGGRGEGGDGVTIVEFDAGAFP